jgi:hypothetical protein
MASIPQGTSISRSIGLRTKNGAAVVFSNDWTCRIQLRTSAGALTPVNRYVTTKNEDGTKFTFIITHAETLALALGDYVLGYELLNAVTGECAERRENIRVEAQSVY